MSRRAAILTTLCAGACLAQAPRQALATDTAKASDANSISLTTPARAHLAHALKASDTAHLRYLSASGSLLLEEGQTSGTLPGKMRAHVNIGSTFSGSFVTYTRYGTIVGHGRAIPHGSGTYESFSGTLVVTGGSGRYAHAHGTARLYGTFDRRNYAFVVQTTGTLLY
jgi:hypothetical protein